MRIAFHAFFAHFFRFGKKAHFRAYLANFAHFFRILGVVDLRKCALQNFILDVHDKKMSLFLGLAHLSLQGGRCT
jgi:hypothetical protein